MRLRASLDFRRVWGARRSRSGRFMALRWRENQLGHARVGFSVSAKVGGAAQRNLVKRRLREAARPLLKDLDRGLDLVVVARPEAAKAGLSELASEFRELLGAVLPLSG